jgi:hypothetical protein
MGNICSRFSSWKVELRLIELERWARRINATSGRLDAISSVQQNSVDDETASLPRDVDIAHVDATKLLLRVAASTSLDAIEKRSRALPEN